MEIFSYPFFQRALVGTLIISVAAAIIGVYIMSRRMLFISGGVTHACFGGLGLGYFLGVSPLAMAAVFAVGGSLGVDWLASKPRVRKDSAIAVIWAVGMALGILFIFLSGGYVPELNSLLFGNVLTVSFRDLISFSIYTALLLLFFLPARRAIAAVSFDPAFSRVNGMPVRWLDCIMTVFVAVGIVLSIRIAGIMMLMSLLSLPPMIAETRTRRFNALVAASVVISAVGCALGLLLAYLIGVPASATIVLLLALFYLAARIF